MGERGGHFNDLAVLSADIDETYFIRAGKFRRYHGESWFRRLTDIPTIYKNVRDLFYFTLGFFQACVVIKRVHPDIVFLKGGFVGLPVGLAAVLLRVPIITHDSDVVPGLANRLVGRWAAANLVAHDPSIYKYSKSKTEKVGVIVSGDYAKVDTATQNDYKKQLNIPAGSKLLLITGGSTGAQTINKAVAGIAHGLLDSDKKLYIVHQVGAGKAAAYTGIKHERLEVLEFLKPMYMYTGAADLVVCRGSANTLAELGVQKKPVITIPSPHLAGGHQTKNAKHLAESQAVVVISEPLDGQQLKECIVDLLRDSNRRDMLATNLNNVTHSDAAPKVAELILSLGASKK